MGRSEALPLALGEILFLATVHVKRHVSLPTSDPPATDAGETWTCGGDQCPCHGSLTVLGVFYTFSRFTPTVVLRKEILYSHLSGRPVNTFQEQSSQHTS